MSISNELRYISSNLSELFTHRIFQTSFKKTEEIFPELWRGQVLRTERQTDGEKDRPAEGRIDRQADAGNDNNHPVTGWSGKNQQH